MENFVSAVIAAFVTAFILSAIFVGASQRRADRAIACMSRTFATVDYCRVIIGIDEDHHVESYEKTLLDPR